MILLVTGFFIGIIYTSKVDVKTVIFNAGVLTNFRGYELGYIIQERVGVLILVIFLSQVHWKQIYGSLLTVIIGISIGSLLTTAICEMKMRGLLIFIIAILPHMCFYGLSYLILICYWLDEKKGRWRWNKTLGVIVFMSIGILCEVYVNPFLLKIFLR